MGCAPQNMRIQPQYDLTSIQQSPRRKVTRNIIAPIFCTKIIDKRLHKANALTTIDEEDLLAWTKKALLHESQNRIFIVENNFNSESIPIVSIKKTYVNYMPLVMSATVVLIFEYLGDKLIFRGHHTKGNWNNTKAEHRKVLDVAMRDALRKLLNKQFQNNNNYSACDQVL